MDSKQNCIMELTGEGDRIGKFVTADSGVGYFVIPDYYYDDDIDYVDIAACIEYTLHELLNAGYTDDEVSNILNVEKDDEYSQDEGISIDLGYCIREQILEIEEV